jgi:putative endonuclease
MAWVYILESISKKRYYIGCTNSITRRVREHELGKVFSTKYLLPIRVVLIQEYSSLSQARKIESRLKRLKRKDYIKKIVEDGYIRMGA